jgi:hypothetical protein
VEGEELVGAAKNSHKVVFEGLDGAFGTIALMVVWWHKLVVDIPFCLRVLLKLADAGLSRRMWLGANPQSIR